MRMLALVLAIPLFAGCRITETDVVKTGLFENDLKRLSDAYEIVDKKKKAHEKISVEQMQKELNWDFKAPNVRHLSGRTAFPRMFGNSVYQGALAEVTRPKPGEEKSSRVDALMEDMEQYFAIFIPYKDVTTVRDRFYFTTKNTTEQGDDLMILFMFKNDVLVYCDYEYVKIDSSHSESAFAQGFLDLAEKVAGISGPIRDLADSIKNVIDRQRDK